MIIIHSKKLNGYVVLTHGKFGLSMMATDENRMVAINKALERMQK